jgi:tRNA threonylcarbamoyl adenosine modification protein (Sua5/YciO/YrdC/YwlC family)
MLIRIYPENPNPKEVAKAVEALRSDGVIIYPTDGVYAFGCSLHSIKAIDRIKTIRNKRDDELTIVCDDFSRVSEFARMDNAQFKILKRNLPGEFTFILKASGRVPDKALGRRKSVGVRIPANGIPVAIVRELDFPMVTASVKDPDELIEYTTDPELIHERYGRVVDMVIDGGYSDNTPTTLVDLTTDEPEIIREGGGELRL